MCGDIAVFSEASGSATLSKSEVIQRSKDGGQESEQPLGGGLVEVAADMPATANGGNGSSEMVRRESHCCCTVFLFLNRVTRVVTFEISDVLVAVS